MSAPGFGTGLGGEPTRCVSPAGGPPVMASTRIAAGRQIPEAYDTSARAHRSAVTHPSKDDRVQSAAPARAVLCGPGGAGRAARPGRRPKLHGPGVVGTAAGGP